MAVLDSNPVLMSLIKAVTYDAWLIGLVLYMWVPLCPAYATLRWLTDSFSCSIVPCVPSFIVYPVGYYSSGHSVTHMFTC